MEKISYDVIKEIQRKVNIVDVISEYIPIEQRGKNYFAICPFHDDHNPSMSISPEKQIYTCFVCGESGNVFNFIMNYEKISFTSAVLKVASKVGINLDIRTYDKKNSFIDKNQKFYDIYDIACKFYQNNINTVYGRIALDYLNKRKINLDAIKTFKIGLSLDDNKLSSLLKSKKYSDDDLVNSGICGLKDKYLYDTFRNRITFPIHNKEGNVVGFSGRIYNGEDTNKYLNSKESVIFKKGEILYNYHLALNHAREKKQIIVVEGFMDVIRLYMIGIKNVVATMGTAITKNHANSIMHLSKNVILCFDGDKAGEKATLSALKELNDIGIDPKIIRLEDDLDPDDYILKKGKDMFLNHLKMPITSFEYKLNLNKKNTDFNNFEEISEYVKKTVNELSKINDNIVYELTIKKIAKETNLDIETIKSIAKKTDIPDKIFVTKRKEEKKDKYIKAEEYLVYYMLRNIDAIKLYENKVSYLSNKKLSRIAMEILEFYDQNKYINTTDFTLFLKDKKELINEVLRIEDLNLPDDMKEEQIIDYIKTIDDGIIKKEIQKLKESINKEIDVTKKITLLEKLRTLKKRIRSE